ncbi:unnamed protein product [Clonostachys rosea f. rosea IK726]|uniref:Uncharacterized protein n=2 Tax=Bionectria ochroleuca TaxID=29856 RepID=A0ACA9TMA6_BIOOC|nr:unnamed protein product [Clonostachys rosea f. rosea IK726]
MDDIFTQHRPLIKRLYQEERKSLKQVKEILESEYQFPESSLAFYEIKLRDLLGVRKKFKKEDWPVIYQHHLNSNRKYTALYLDGVKFPWKKAWKEIRRSGAREATIGESMD